MQNLKKKILIVISVSGLISRLARRRMVSNMKKNVYMQVPRIGHW